MANTQAIKRRIRSVKNTSQITKAMELVAASRLRKAQEASQRSSAFRVSAREILSRIAELTDVSTHPLYAQRTVKSKLYIVVNSDRGLAGSYNTYIAKEFVRLVTEDQQNDIKSSVITVGKQIGRTVAKLDAINKLGSYENFPDQPSATDLQPILSTATEQFTNGSVDEVVVLYTEFKSSLTQEVASFNLLPASFTKTKVRADLDKSVFEPSPKAVLNKITPKLVEVQLLQAFLEAAASEHAMRMMAMKNASDNAGDLVEDLNLEFNSARQASITQELAEISAGAEALV